MKMSNPEVFRCFEWLISISNKAWSVSLKCTYIKKHNHFLRVSKLQSFYKSVSGVTATYTFYHSDLFCSITHLGENLQDNLL